MIQIPKIKRPSKAVVKKLQELGSATVSGTLYHLGITNPFILGPTQWTWKICCWARRNLAIFTKKRRCI